MPDGAVSRRHVLLRWGLPRDPRAGEHVLGFALTTVVTIVVTRGYLQVTGFPQIGGETLHVAHVLWGGLFMALAMVLALSFAGPVVRPLVAFLGGIGFGLFIDEVGKFLTQDNDYFFQPAPMIMYVTLVALVVLAADEGTPAWARWAAAASSVLVALVAARGWVLLRSDRYAAFQWVRRALTVQLLVTVVALYRIDPWPATAVMAVALLGLGVVQAEKVRLEQAGQGAPR